MNKEKIQNVFDRFLISVNEISNFCSASSLLNWDQEVLMPVNGAESRSKVYETLALHIHHLTESQSFISDIKFLLDNQDLLSDFQYRCLHRYHQEAKRSWKMSKELIGQLAKTTAIAQSEWAKAKKEKSFSIFMPYLESIVALKQEEAKQIGFNDHPYDALLDEYEPGLKTKLLDQVFSESLPKLKNLRMKFIEIIQKKNIEDISISKDIQNKFVQKILSEIGFNFNKGRIDVGNHPATAFIHNNDIRIISRFDEETFFTGIFLTLHEMGHGLYYQNIDESYLNTPLYEGASTSMHESQARLWENYIAKSISFWKGQFSFFQSLSSSLSSKNLNNFICYINRISTSPIRFDADEISYVFHIYIRYLLEKKLIDGSLSVSDIPEYWNNLMEEYLNIKVNDVSDGCLQDVHWSCGLIGYFPTYYVGTIYAAEIYKLMKDNIPLEELLSNNQYSEILHFLINNIYKHGSYYTSIELREKLIKTNEMSSDVFIEYLKEKYHMIDLMNR